MKRAARSCKETSKTPEGRSATFRVQFFFGLNCCTISGNNSYKKFVSRLGDTSKLPSHHLPSFVPFNIFFLFLSLPLTWFMLVFLCLTSSFYGRIINVCVSFVLAHFAHISLYHLPLHTPLPILPAPPPALQCPPLAIHPASFFSFLQFSCCFILAWSS